MWQHYAWVAQMSNRWISVDIIEAIRQNDAVGMVCMLICAGLSIISWSIILYKFFQLRRINRLSGNFVDRCMNQGLSLEEAYKLTAEYKNNPLAHLLRESYLEAEVENWYQDYKEMPTQDKLTLAKVDLDRIIEQTISYEMKKMEGGVNFLAMTASVAPLLGLFGTVWGILGCFQTVAYQSGIALASLAPGISTALMTTIVGLFAAVPAVVSYNYFTARIQAILAQMDSFSMEISNIIQKQIIKQEKYAVAR